MIRIEGIPIVAARLAASLKTVGIPATAQVFHQTQRTLSTRPSATVRTRRPRANARVCLTKGDTQASLET